MSTTPSIPGVDRAALVEVIDRDTGGGWLARRAAEAALAHIAAHHECSTLPATWDDGGARPVEGEHGWVTPLLPDGEGVQRFPDGTPVEAWHPAYGDGLRTLYYVEGRKHTDVHKVGASGFPTSWQRGTLIRPVLPPTAPACDREHDDEWVEVESWGDPPEGALVRREWKWDRGDAARFFIHRDDLPDDPRALITREFGPERADSFLGLLDEHGWTVTRKGER